MTDFRDVFPATAPCGICRQVYDFPLRNSDNQDPRVLFGRADLHVYTGWEV